MVRRCEDGWLGEWEGRRTAKLMIPAYFICVKKLNAGDFFFFHSVKYFHQLDN